MKWLELSLLSTLLYGFASHFIVLIQRLQKRSSTWFLQTQFYIGINIITICLIGYYLITSTPHLKTFYENFKKIIANEKDMLLLAFLCTVLLISGNFLLYTSYLSSPNPGLCDLIATLASLVVLIITNIFFKTKIKVVNVIGMCLSIIGLGLLSKI